MRTILFIVITAVSAFANAHCPVPLVVDGANYCLDVEWLPGDKKVKGVLQETDLLSPYMNVAGLPPAQWIYSKARVSVWVDGDKNHVPVELPNFRIFPFMVMADGHHHGASSTFTYDAAQGAYVLSNSSLQAMDGCWSLRWTLAATDDMATSLPVINVTSFSNLNDVENKTAAEFCSAEPQEPGEGGHHHH